MTIPVYNTGTVSVAANGTVVFGGGTTIWANNVREGDWIVIDGQAITMVLQVTDDDHLVIPEWKFGAKTTVTYAIYQNYSARDDANAIAKDVGKFVAAFNKEGFIWFVGPGETEPDPSNGDEGQWAYQPSTGKQWHKEGGAWVFDGLFKTFGTPAPYDNDKTYSLNEVATSNGSSYVWINSTPGAGHAPPNATYWAMLAERGPVGPGATVEIGTVATGAPGTSASVTNVGTDTEAIFNFTIPRGSPGAGDVSSVNNLSELSNKRAALDNISTKGADVASATVINLEGATGDLVDITGNVTIDTITLAEGHHRTVRFAGSPQLTNSATLIFPGGASIKAASGDFAVFRGYAAGVVRCVYYSKLSGKPITSSMPTRYWQGYTHSNSVGSPNTVIDVAAGSARDSTDTADLINASGSINCATVGANGLDVGALGSPTTVAISNASPAVVTWAAHGFEVNQAVSFSTTGVLPTGLTAGATYYVVGLGLTSNSFRVAASLANAWAGTAINTSSAGSGTHTGTAALDYPTFAIATSGGATAFLASLSPTAPTLPATYTKFRRIGCVRCDALGNLLPFVHVNDQWWFKTSLRRFQVSDLGTTPYTFTAGPRVQGIWVRFAATVVAGTPVSVSIYPGFLTSSAASGTIAYNGSSGVNTGEMQTDSIGRITAVSTSAATTFVVDIAGWRDPL